jgi:acetamidase/formamidase
MATTHRIEPIRPNLHGHFSSSLAPVLTIDSGDRVIYSTLDAGWGLIHQPRLFCPPERLEPRDPELDGGHALCGPIAIRGAEPGMTLEVRILSLQVGAWGWSYAGGFTTPLNERLGVADGFKKMLWYWWSIRADEGVAVNQHGRAVRIRPFPGILGMPPAEPGVHSTVPPRPTGGNIDCKELLPGSSLFLPIAVAGGLFSAGDGHAVQGDGEISGSALECPLERLELEFVLHPTRTLAMPRANTPAGWITFGFHENLDEATALALEAMLDLLDELTGCGRKDAVALASLLVDLRITQITNELRGVHAILPHGALEPSSVGG